MNTRKILVSVGAAALIIVIGFAGKAFFASQKKKQPKTNRPTSLPGVRALPVKYTDQETELIYYGRVGAFQSVEIIAEVAGKIQRGAVNLKAGQRVSRGQLIASIDDKEARLSLQSLKSQFQKSIADILADLKVDYPDRFPEWQQYFEALDISMSLPKLPPTKTTKEKTFLSTRGIFSTYYNILSQEERLKKYSIFAPVSGSFSQVMLEPGSVANPGSRLATLQRTDQLELIIPVATGDIGFVQQGAEVEISTEGSNMTWQGKVVRIGKKVDIGTQSVNVYVSIGPRQDAPLMDGQYLQARIPGKVVRKVMEIPRKAIVGKDQAFVLKSDTTLRLSAIRIHKLNSKTALVSGLDEGVNVVTEPPLNAVEDMKVKIIAVK